MKVVLCLAAFALFAAVQASPLPENEQDLELYNIPAGELTEEHVNRFKRATCDLLSFTSKWVTPNHAGCAAHCLVKGYKGGYCKNAICHCRK